MSATFVSRESDLETLERMFASPAVSTVVITGESGVGKTTLASRVYQFESEVGSRFARRARVVAFRSGNMFGPMEEWLVTAVAEQLELELTPNARPDEVVEQILVAASNNAILLLLDNVESIQPEWLDGFVRRWNALPPMSLLLLTTSHAPWAPKDAPSRTAIHEMHGLNGESAILAVYGPELTDRLPHEALLREASKLRNNPQSLMYLRLLQPDTVEDLERLASGLLAATPDLYGEIGLLEAIEGRVGGPVTPFLALGRLLSIEVDEDLLAWLWQVLGGGSVERYIGMRDELVRIGLMSRVPGSPTDRVAVNPSVHIHLEKELLRKIGRAHINHIDYYIAEYYRNKCERTDQMRLDHLGAYVYHSIACGNWRSAAEYVTNATRLGSIHNRGMALQLRPILELVDQRLDALTATPESRPILHAAVTTELAQCANDLSNHAQCLDLLTKAERLVTEGGVRGGDHDGTLREINYLRGISYSDVGQSIRCIESYMRVVVESGQDLDARAILALGYLAFELRFHDVHRAQKLGERAVQLARSSGDRLLIARTACSCGQTQFFARSPEAASLFGEAEEACRRVPTSRSDIRELGRVLIHASMTRICDGNIAGALAMLSEAQAINEQTGDRRRRASCLALRGVALFRQSRIGGDPKLADQGKVLLLEAIDLHLALEDWRNAVPEALSVAYIDGCPSLEDALACVRGGVDTRWAAVVTDAGRHDIADSGDTAASVFGRYWDENFRPLLLDL